MSVVELQEILSWKRVEKGNKLITVFSFLMIHCTKEGCNRKLKVFLQLDRINSASRHWAWVETRTWSFFFNLFFPFLLYYHYTAAKFEDIGCQYTIAESSNVFIYTWLSQFHFLYNLFFYFSQFTFPLYIILNARFYLSISVKQNIRMISFSK